MPRSWPAQQTGPTHGKWLTDVQDATAYFVPATNCGGVTPGVWEGEARKHLNLYPLAEQKKRNTATVLVGWPLEAVGWTVLAFGSAGGGGGSYGGYGRKR